MMAIRGGDVNHPTSAWGSWHTGETMRVPKGPVVVFQMDGHELQWFLNVVEKSGVVLEYPAKRLTPVL